MDDLCAPASLSPSLTGVLWGSSCDDVIFFWLELRPLAGLLFCGSETEYDDEEEDDDDDRTLRDDFGDAAFWDSVAFTAAGGVDASVHGESDLALAGATVGPNICTGNCHALPTAD